MKLDGFLLSMAAAMVLALLAPTIGMSGGVLHLEIVTHWGIALIFFLHGVMLSPHAVRSGARKWRLHLLVQASTFVLFPLLGVVLYVSTGAWLSHDLRLGLFLLCAMSSTVSSSVALTAMARGDVVSAMFNASASGLLGIFITPFLIQLVTATQTSMPLLDSIRSILLTLAVPFFAGQILRSFLIERLQPHKAWVNRLDRSVILLIVYGSFCDATAAGVWRNFSVTQLLLVIVLAALLLLVMLVVTWQLSGFMRFTPAERIAVLFCGSKKSLASGAPIARVLFAAHPGLALIMLPLMIYHQLQLIVCTLLARRFALRTDASPDTTV